MEENILWYYQNLIAYLQVESNEASMVNYLCTWIWLWTNHIIQVLITEGHKLQNITYLN